MRSGLQNDVLILYRDCWRAARSKPLQSRPHWYQFIREQFRQHQNIPRSDFNTVEYYVRRGRRQLEIYSQPSITDIH
ncbi:uncharacterized protein VTP21DRAFT_8403 [Calcarisporiella thermophila]|uniref:uncharacterized protein n=1 Tax=Calcarisporiella thermophila TaxID=911321 RepID=UPI003744355A